MKHMTTIAIVVAVLAGGCGGGNEQKDGAYKRWYTARARVVQAVGEECFRAGDLDKAYSNAAEAVKLNGEHLPARLLVAKVLIEKGQYAQAIEQLKQAEQLAPESEEVAYLMGVALERRRDFAEALGFYQKARALNPANSAYVKANAEVLVSMNKPHRALELVQMHLERNDGEQGMLALCGELAMLVGETALAVDCYQKCFDADPKDSSLQEGLAKAHFFNSDYAKALTLLKKLDESAYQGKACWPHIMMGDSLLALNRPREARTAFQRATAAAPDEPKAWICLAKAAVALDDPDEVILAARQVISLSGESLEVATLLGHALMRQGRIPQAKKVLTAAAARYPQDATLQCMLGRCYEALGQKDKARACYAQALRVDPEHMLAKVLLESENGEAAPIR